VEVRKGVIYLTRDEVDEACPANPRWAASQIRSYGPARCARSGKLSPLLSCISLLESVGLDYVILDEAESEAKSEAVEVMEPEVVETEVGLPPAEVTPARGVVPEGLCNCPPVG